VMHRRPARPSRRVVEAWGQPAEKFDLQTMHVARFANGKRVLSNRNGLVIGFAFGEWPDAKGELVEPRGRYRTTGETSRVRFVAALNNHARLRCRSVPQPGFSDEESGERLAPHCTRMCGGLESAAIADLGWSGHRFGWRDSNASLVA